MDSYERLAEVGAQINALNDTPAKAKLQAKVNRLARILDFNAPPTLGEFLIGPSGHGGLN